MISAKNADVASAANLPAISLPISSMSDKDHMPIGMELASVTGYDRRLIAVARALENIILGHEH
jgi:Asp-tRNA(Asn)/Glu-tRNA(Gln) amidotransferase A subunit family amidase